MSENQKLREALLSDMDIAVLRMPVNMAFAGNMAQFQYHNRVQSLLNRIDALALPTADHLPDAGKVIETAAPGGGYVRPVVLDARQALPTAAPVGDLADLPRYTAWSHLKTHGRWPEGIDRSWMKDEMGRYNDVTVSNAVIAELRAALSAGDAVDAQRYRWLMDNCTLGIKQNGVGWSLNTTACIAPDCIKDVGATIDAAMRKGQL